VVLFGAGMHEAGLVGARRCGRRLLIGRAARGPPTGDERSTLTVFTPGRGRREVYVSGSGRGFWAGKAGFMKGPTTPRWGW